MPRFSALDASMPERVMPLLASKVIATLLLTATSSMAQLPALDLESPILPGPAPGMATPGAIVSSPQPMILPQGAIPAVPANTGVTYAPHGMAPHGVVSPGVASHGVSASAIPVGEYQAGPITHGQQLPNQVVQTSFVGCTSCGSVGCHGCDDYGPGYQCPPSGLGLWFRADYLSWYESGMDTIPLVTSSSSTPADTLQLLTLDADETNIEFGGREYDHNPRHGWRLEVGTWLDPNATYGIFGRYFSVDNQSWSFSADSDDFNNLGLPFFDSDINAEDAVDLRIPGERDGAVDASISTRLKSWEVLFRRLEQTGPNYRLDWVYGYRNLNMEESLDLTARTLVIGGGNATLGTDILLNDSFQLENQFHGIDLGVTGHSQEGAWSLDFLLKVALGVMEQEVLVNGDTRIEIPAAIDGDPPTIARNVGGLFSQETNVGPTDNSEFGVIPEFNLNLGYAITPNFDFTVGYTFIYVHGMTRVGSVVDRVVDSGLLGDLDPVNSTRPRLNFDSVSYHIHGINLGVTARF